MSQRAKLNACVRMYEADPAIIFVAWFEETAHALSKVLPAATILQADNVHRESIQNKLVVFVEHYPLRTTEQQLFAQLQLSDVPVLSSLDEPFFRKFAGDRTIEIMQKLGMNEDEVLGHAMITKSIKNAQRKIESKIAFDHKAISQQEWMDKNVSG